MFVSVPFPKSTGGTVASGYVRKRLSDQPFTDLSESVVTNRSTLLAEAQASFPGVTAEQCYVEFFLAGGGGAGASGTNVPGGQPGIVTSFEMALADFDATTSIYFDLGAGGIGQIGAGGGDGSTSSITQYDADYNDIVFQRGFGGPGGQPDTQYHKYLYMQQSALGARYLDPALSDSGIYNPLGGGGGGSNRNDQGFGVGGGYGNSAMPQPYRGSYGPPDPGQEPDDTDFYGVGGGGGGSASGAGSAGALSAGGGASGSSFAGASGGNGAIRYRFFVWEIV